MNFFTDILKSVLSLLWPVLLIGLGALVAAAGLNFEINFLIWTGLIITAAGVLWGAILYFLHEG